MAQLWRALVLTESQDSVSKAQAHQSLYLWLQGLWGPLLACLGTCTQVTYTYTQVHTHKIKHFLKGRKKNHTRVWFVIPHPLWTSFWCPGAGRRVRRTGEWPAYQLNCLTPQNLVWVKNIWGKRWGGKFSGCMKERNAIRICLLDVCTLGKTRRTLNTISLCLYREWRTLGMWVCRLDKSFSYGHQHLRIQQLKGKVAATSSAVCNAKQTASASRTELWKAAYKITRVKVLVGGRILTFSRLKIKEYSL